MLFARAESNGLTSAASRITDLQARGVLLGKCSSPKMCSGVELQVTESGVLMFLRVFLPYRL